MSTREMVVQERRVSITILLDIGVYLDINGQRCSRYVVVEYIEEVESSCVHEPASKLRHCTVSTIRLSRPSGGGSTKYGDALLPRYRRCRPLVYLSMSMSALVMLIPDPHAAPASGGHIQLHAGLEGMLEMRRR